MNKTFAEFLLLRPHKSEDAYRIDILDLILMFLVYGFLDDTCFMLTLKLAI